MSDQNIPDEMQEIIEDFMNETKESLSELERVFVDLEADPKNLELINSVFRTIHSLKGAADFLGFKRMVEVAHKSESLLNQLRKETITLTPDIMDVVFEAVDLIKVLLHEIENEVKDGVDIKPTVGKLVKVLEGGSGSKHSDQKEDAPEKVKTKSSKKSKKKDPDSSEEGPLERAEKEEIKEKGDQDDTMPQDEVPPIMEVSEPEPVQVPAKPSPVAEQQDETPTSGSILEPKKDLLEGGIEQTIRVEVERLDTVMNFVGELVLSRNRMLQINQSLETIFGDDPNIESLIETTLHLSRLTTDLQLAVLKTRMQPMRKVFSKIPRMVRDLARKKKKEVYLKIEGEETEVDKSIIEEIGDPLVHLIRNAVDHGIEIADFRGPLGKPEKGLIRVAAYHEGDHIVIEIEDDGKGINPEALRQKALEKGFIDTTDAERLSEKECMNLIFHPGFSTAEKVTSTSGRGVGMDVVKSNISKLNGTVSVSSIVGEGTQMRIRLPLTIAIIQALMVGVGEEIFAIPLSSVVETLRVEKSEIQTIDEKDVITLRDEILPLVHLSEWLDIPLKDQSDGENGYVVVTGIAERKLGIVVTKLYGQEEIVIKPLGHYLKARQEFSGATLTGDGKVVMIIDINGLLGQGVMA